MRNPRLLLLLLAIALTAGLALLRPLSSRAADGGRRHLAGARRTHHVMLGERVVKYAKRWIGVPYRWGGSSPRSGFDCSGFVRYVYAHFGVSLPHSSYADFDRGRRVGRWALKPGDLVFFHSLGHVGIYVGHGRFIHAPHTGTRVSIASLRGGYGSDFDGARRLR